MTGIQDFIASGEHFTSKIVVPSSGQIIPGLLGQKTLNIVIYSTQVIPTNPDLDEYGGLELIAGLQAKYFTEQGHNVSLFACKNSYFSTNKEGKHIGPENGHLYAVGEKGTNPVAAWKTYWDDPRTRTVLKEADIIVNHSWNFYPYAVYNELKNICSVWHGPDPGFRVPPPYPKTNLIAISFSHAQRMMKMAPGTEYRTIHNGLPVYKYTFNSKPIAERERLLWLSRIYEPKGAHRAIDIANSMKMPIDIVGGSFGDVPAYTNKIKKMCEDSQYATFHGEVNFAKKLEFYRNAKCIILPIIESGFETIAMPGWEWHEPFGLVTGEAGSCGTPTIVTPNGGWTETMIHGYNGYLANNDKEFEYYLRQIDNINPTDCRKMAERFDYKIMGENYLRIFKEIIEGRGW